MKTSHVLSTPLKLSAKMLLSKDAVLYPAGIKSQSEELQSIYINLHFTLHPLSLLKRLSPCPGASFEPGDRLTNILVFHDGSSLTFGVSIYLAVETKGKKRIAIAKAGSKSDYCTVPVMEHVSRSCSIVMPQPLINVLKRAGAKG